MSVKRLAIPLLVWWWSLWVLDAERGWVIRSLHAAYETCELAAWQEGHLALWYTPEQLGGFYKALGIKVGPAVRFPDEPERADGLKPTPLPPPRPFSGCMPVQATHTG